MALSNDQKDALKVLAKKAQSDTTLQEKMRALGVILRADGGEPYSDYNQAVLLQQHFARLDIEIDAEMLEAGEIPTEDEDGEPLPPPPAMCGGYEFWITQGRAVNKGASAYYVCYAGNQTEKDDGGQPVMAPNKDGQMEEQRFHFARWLPVFAVEDTHEIPAEERAKIMAAKEARAAAQEARGGRGQRRPARAPRPAPAYQPLDTVAV